MKKLSVVIVNYNVKYYVEQCLVSLRKALRGIDAEVFVVDNHSRDGSAAYLASRFQDIQFINSNHNLGFSRANNVAIRRSRGEYVLLLNPDTIVAEETIAEVLQFMDAHAQAGGLGVRMLKTDGSSAMESRRGLPTPMTAFYKMCGLCAKYPRHRRFGRYYMSFLPWDAPVQIEVMSGAFCLLRRAALDKAGLLDEDFFMYGEDIDLSYRILQEGFENWYHPAPILHYKGESTQKSSFRYVHVFYEAMLIFFKKHYSGMSVLLGVPVKTAIYARAFVALVQMQLHQMKKSIGLLRAKREVPPLYLCIGEKDALTACEEIGRSKGLECELQEGNRTTLPAGHLSLSFDRSRRIFVVYDVHAYAYGDIFSLFAKRPQANVLMGMYDKETKVMITEDDIYT